MKRGGLLILLLCFFTSLKADVEHIGNLRHGMVLYEYYQRNYFSALSQLQIAQVEQPFESLSHQAQLLEGSISLLFGLEQHAANRLTNLLSLENQLNPESKNTAWLYLAKLHHRQGNFGLAARRLDKMQPPRNRRDDALIELRDERYALMIDIAIRQGYLAIAESHLAEWRPKPSLAWAYAEFNLASAFAREGEYANAIRHYQRLTELAPVYDVFRDREFLGLYDKALVNSGYSRLRLEQYDRAIVDFKRVRQQGDNTPQALMAWGWAEQLRKQPQAALQPWQALVALPEGQRYRQSALLGLPGLYEELEQYPQAVSAYEEAEHNFEQALQSIDELVNAVDTQAISELLNIEAIESFSAGDFLRTTDTSKPMLSPWLYRLEASAEFQMIRQELASIIAMQQLLDGWRGKLDIWRDILAQRAVRRDTHKQNIANQQFANHYAALASEHQRLSSSLEADVNQHQFMAFLPVDRANHFKRLERAIATAKLLEREGKRVAPHQKRLIRLEGLLLWQGVENMPAAKRKQEKHLAEIERLLSGFNRQIQSLENTLHQAPDITPFEQRLETLADNLNDVGLALSAVKSEKEGQIRFLMQAELEALDKKLSRYLLAARLSLARIYDGSFGQE